MAPPHIRYEKIDSLGMKEFSILIKAEFTNIRCLEHSFSIMGPLTTKSSPKKRVLAPKNL